LEAFEAVVVRIEVTLEVVMVMGEECSNEMMGIAMIKNKLKAAILKNMWRHNFIRGGGRW